VSRSCIFELVSDGDELTAVLVRKSAPRAGPGAAEREERRLLPPVVVDLAGRVVEGEDLFLAIAWGGLVDGEIPYLVNKDIGDLAEIDQRLAALRDRFGAQPWPPLPDP